MAYRVSFVRWDKSENICRDSRLDVFMAPHAKWVSSPKLLADATPTKHWLDTEDSKSLFSTGVSSAA
jgi:hypothetical protein